MLARSLELSALQVIRQQFENSSVFSLPRLHAKVYVADERSALISSANLTGSGLDRNLEYGVLLDEAPVVSQVRRDLEDYARLGAAVADKDLAELLEAAEELKGEFKEVTRSANREIKNRFNRTLLATRQKFVATQVGERSANSVFSEAILYALSRGPLTTRKLHPEVQRLLPDLCDNTVELIINGEKFGKRWKHDVRNAQQHLKKTGQIAFDGKVWVKP